MAVKALLHYALEVPDQGAGEKFYSNFGLLNAPSRDSRGASQAGSTAA